jgi:cell division protein FtsI (penicillin-binding protein 3)
VTGRRPATLASLRQRRLLCLAIAAIAGHAALAARALQLGALDAKALQDDAADQHTIEVRVEGVRGQILDRRGEVLVKSVPVMSVAAWRHKVTDARYTARVLGKVLRVPQERIAKKLRGQDAFIWLARWVSPEEAKRVRQLGLPGVELVPEHGRWYPNGTLAASLLGFSGHDDHGLSGLEQAYDSILHGRDASVSMAVDGVRRPLPSPQNQAPDASGDTLYLTIDSVLQRAAEQALVAGMERTGARAASLVALDPRDGEVLALAEVPGFDPNRFWREDERLFRPRSFVHSFEPGSTLKPFVVALALEAGAVRADEEFDCENGRMQLRSGAVRDMHPYGVLSVRDIVRVSSNIGASKIGARLGSQSLVDGLQRFGFGARTGSRFPGENPGVLRMPGKAAEELELANLSFGQGIGVTAVQLAAAGAALANGGFRVVPRLALRSENGEEVHWFGGNGGERAVTAQTAHAVLDMMVNVVEHGTGAQARLPHHTVAGKTGTAQKVVDGRYAPGRYVVSFMGIVPAEQPRLVVVVVLDEPDEKHTGGSAAAPVFKDFAARAVGQLALTPTPPPPGRES